MPEGLVDQLIYPLSSPTGPADDRTGPETGELQGSIIPVAEL